MMIDPIEAMERSRQHMGLRQGTLYRDGAGCALGLLAFDRAIRKFDLQHINEHVVKACSSRMELIDEYGLTHEQIDDIMVFFDHAETAEEGYQEVKEYLRRHHARSD